MNTVAGVFVEPRMVEQIYFNIENFFKVLPDNNLYFFCGKNTKSIHITNLKKYQYNETNLIIHELDVHDLDFTSYSALFKSFYILDKVKEDFILTIQTDGCLCEKSQFNIRDFLKYDYVGGYAFQKWWWKETQNLHDYNEFQCFNGGFSLRNKQAMIKVVKTFPPKNTLKFFAGCKMEHFPEDLYFVVGMLKLKMNVGLDEFSTRFCTHTSYIKPTFCVHKLHSYEKKENILKFLEYCPEYKRFTNLNKIEM
tara:strand:- start:47 stop:802 length:756 start_codon:yes stop_codon:yes gene_type:complete